MLEDNSFEIVSPEDEQNIEQTALNLQIRELYYDFRSQVERVIDQEEI